MLKFLRASSIVGLLLTSLDTFAWGDLGHRIICEIAFGRLEPAPKDEVVRLINQDSEFATFAESCTWPDHPSMRSPEHYINVPRSYTAISVEDCTMADSCLFTAIPKDLSVLEDNSASDQEKLGA
jgi:hypothetical protein